MRRHSYRQAVGVGLLISFAVLSSSKAAFAQAGSISAGSRITGQIDEKQLVTLAGNTHPLAMAKLDQGAVADEFPMEHMYLQLRRSTEQDKELESVLEDLQNPRSANYHHWLTAEELGAKYGPSQKDIDAVVSWLSSHGLTVNQVFKSGTVIDVSGNAGQVRDAFHTEIHAYNVKGQQHIANASDPQIPAALSAVVAGLNSLNDFMPKPALRKPHSSFSFKFNGAEQYDEAPADFATIYNVTPLYSAKTPITGKGQTVVVLEETDVLAKDIATFRSAFGLSSYAGTFTQIHPGIGCGDPGRDGAEGEAALDSEWAGAIAPDADVKLASCKSTSTNFGPFIAAQNLLNQATPPPIMSLSYLSCEASNGPSGSLFYYYLWQQAAMEGVSVFVAAGDNGAAGCDDFDVIPTWATGGIQANALASTPFDVATGGTDFLDTAENNNAEYWTTTNSANRKSAKSYIPEMPWNDSCGSSVLAGYFNYTNLVDFCNGLGLNWLDIIAGSGAPSVVWAKPYWQKGVYGTPKDGARDLPDISLFASNGFWGHAILFCMSDPTEGGTACDYSNPLDAVSNSAGGTSFTAPQFASIQALINQKAGGPQGNPDPIYYDLAATEYGSRSAPNWGDLKSCNSTLGTSAPSSCKFHDVTVGTNSVPCFGTNNCYGGIGLNYGVLSTSDSSLQPAYSAVTGWDFATGLGSINVANVVNSWP